MRACEVRDRTSGVLVLFTDVLIFLINLAFTEFCNRHEGGTHKVTDSGVASSDLRRCELRASLSSQPLPLPVLTHLHFKVNSRRHSITCKYFTQYVSLGDNDSS